MLNPDWCVPPILTSTGPRDTDLAADSRWSHARLYRDWNYRGNSAPFSGRRQCLPKQGTRPPHSSWASCSEHPAPMHNTNATADLSACNGTPATLGQHNDCPDRSNTERTRPVTTPSVLSHATFAPLLSRSNTLMPPMTHRLHTSVTMPFFSGIHLRFFSQGTLSPFTVDLV